jgi:hypothetical protein
MALALYDRVKETTTTVGTGSVTLLGASTGFQSFAVVGNANTTYYCIADQGGANWEVGIGTYTASGTTLARTTVLSSSNAGSLVTFTAGIKDVFVTYPSSKGLWKDASGNAIGLGTPASGVVTNLTGTASININGTVGATTATTGAFTNLAYTGTLTGSTGILNIGSGQVYKDASGNVGIGTSSPQALLDLGGGTLGKGISWNSSSTSSYGNIYTSYTNAQLVIAQGLKGSTTVAGGFQSANSATWAKSAIMLDYGVISFYSNPPDTVTYGTAYTPSERMRIDSSGNVGIGTSSPLDKLYVSSVGTGTIGGVICVANSATPTAGNESVIGFRSASVFGTTYYSGKIRSILTNASLFESDLAFNTYDGSGPNGLEVMRLASSGFVTMAAYGAGAATFSAAGVISSVSDETWKIKDGSPVDADSMLKNLEPGYWYYNDEKAPIFGTDRQLGFYAQNVNAAIGPEAAPTPEEGKPWGYYDRSVLAVTVLSLQKALATIEELTARLTKAGL